jgi:hypothetical protein
MCCLLVAIDDASSCIFARFTPSRVLREQNISTIDEANRFLDAGFLDDYNQRFSSSDSPIDIHRSASGIDLTNIFCFEASRRVYNDWTITWNAQFLQLLSSDVPLPPPRSMETTCFLSKEWQDGMQ